MPTIPEMLSTGLRHHSAGQLAEAERTYREILKIDPTCGKAWHYLGLIAYQTSQNEPAVQYISKALRLDPDDAEAQNNLGVVFHELGRFNEARDCHVHALALRPVFSEAESNLGNALKGLAQLDEAAAHYRAALTIDPNNPDAHSNLGSTLQELGEVENAIQCYRSAIALRPNYAEAYNNLGKALKDEGLFQDAASHYRTAIAMRPNFAEAMANLGDALMSLGNLDEGRQLCLRALELQPNLATAHNNLGSILHAQGLFSEAAARYGRALEINPSHARAHSNLGMLMLLQEDFERGWREYQWRWRTGLLPRCRFVQPQWQGEPLTGKTILLRAEQGLGDTFQFIRYASLVKNLGATVVFECQKPLVKLLTGCAGVDRLVSEDETAPSFDFHCPLLSLPDIFNTTLKSIPANVPYLSAPSELIEHWRCRFQEEAAFKIGINWHGRAGHAQSLLRDIPTTYFEQLAEIRGIRLISLQKADQTRNARDPDNNTFESQRNIVSLGDFDTTRGPFMDTAAIMKNLDLVITSDTAIAHLAGALGVPVWVALPFVPDWRWLLGRSDSPWYPTMRLFRQKSPGDWPTLFAEIAAALRERLPPV